MRNAAAWVAALTGVSAAREREREHAFSRQPDDAPWWHVMGYESGPPRSLEQVERQFRRLAACAHPDRGGDAHQLQRLIQARAQARQQLARRAG